MLFSLRNLLCLQATFFALISLSLPAQAQKSPRFNLDFETQETGKKLADGWGQWGQYSLSIDTQAYSGKQAGKVTAPQDGQSFGCIVYRIPSQYPGDSIKLEGYMKLKNVSDGFAGLILRVDGPNEPLAFASMDEQAIDGTVDWKKYTLTCALPKAGESIAVAGILTGKGEAWFDHFVVTIDGKDVQTLTPLVKAQTKGEQDHAFDEGSQIEFPKLTPALTANLEALGRVWGFLKYHHPAMDNGDYNWDYELFRILPSYLETNSNEARDLVLISWIDQLGKVERCKTCVRTEKRAYLKPDLAWLSNSGFSKKLQKKLQHIYDNRQQGKHYYIELAPGVGNPIFKNENAYRNMAFPDAGFRLLSLYRYWNMIHYFFPYKHLTDQNWNSILTQYLPLFLEAEDELAYEFAALQIIGEIQDTHANLFAGHNKVRAWKGKNYPPIHVGFVEDKLVVLAYYDTAYKTQVGLKRGDVITHVKGQRVEDWVTAHQKYYPASNQPTRLRNMAQSILRDSTDAVEISYLTASGKAEAKTLPLLSPKALKIYEWYRNKAPEKCFRLLDGNIGYVTLENIAQEDIPKIKEQFKDTKGIVIDIRNYPSAFTPFSLGSFFVTESSLFVKFAIGNPQKPGEFNFTPAINISNSGEAYQGKLVVLVNEESQSQAEYTAMAFRAGDNTTIVGSTTAGADGNVSEIFLPGGLRTAISGIGIHYPDGGQTQRIGIVPDVEVKPTIDGIRQGRDELLEKAVELILKE